MATDRAAGSDFTTKSRILDTGASIVQDFRPVKQICAFLNALHVYASDPTRVVEANHYCTHLTEDIRQCLIYDTSNAGARLIGVEYMISPQLYNELPQEERELWHSHLYEVKSGMLIMPAPAGTPQIVWTAAETAEMKDIIGLYGKTYHFWQVDRGDKVPLGTPQLMASLISDDMANKIHPGGRKALLADRDSRFGVNHEEKAETRKDIPVPEKHPDADAMLRGRLP
ncbi:DUF1264 domain protein [Rasamsonia emersonii CBS 393.64]|uniref:DUF1264 domain protein n=1 Tax=Rasamsonia emersonii (strain ATCC 16479 / CBS 393.64 / IMI 116815) TaxID=1408163 RepID=A0A0F4YXE9_RASE3|nr:DUF1264 domain protein [Rasamsonia emersonii CBS 393.64]KKA22755.1 DUF1264 domain protein [Rasamsonia emersonii CBS 393.64]